MAIRDTNLALLNNLSRAAEPLVRELPLAALLARAAQIRGEIIEAALTSAVPA
jgi:hypothetical protein